MSPVELRRRASRLRDQAGKLLVEASGLEAEAFFIEERPCVCGHSETDHLVVGDTEDTPGGRCSFFDLSGRCYCAEYVGSPHPVHRHADTRR